MEVLVKSKIKDICKQKNMTIVELARQTDVTRWTLTRPDCNFRLDTIAKILTVLDCKFEDVFEITSYEVK